MNEKVITTSSNDSNKEPQQLFKNQIMDDECLLTKADLANFLKVSIKTIDKKVHLKEIPFIKIGRLVRFSKSEILAWAKGETH